VLRSVCAVYAFLVRSGTVDPLDRSGLAAGDVAEVFHQLLVSVVVTREEVPTEPVPGHVVGTGPGVGPDQPFQVHRFGAVGVTVGVGPGNAVDYVLSVVQNHLIVIVGQLNFG